MGWNILEQQMGLLLQNAVTPCKYIGTTDGTPTTISKKFEPIGNLVCPSNSKKWIVWEDPPNMESPRRSPYTTHSTHSTTPISKNLSVLHSHIGPYFTLYKQNSRALYLLQCVTISPIQKISTKLCKLFSHFEPWLTPKWYRFSHLFQLV